MSSMAEIKVSFLLVEIILRGRINHLFISEDQLSSWTKIKFLFVKEFLLILILFFPCQFDS